MTNAINNISVKELWDYATALKNFFEVLIVEDRELGSLVNSLSNHLTEPCKEDFRRVERRTDTARRVVDEYMKMDPVELYNLIYNRRRKQGINIQDYGFAIGFQAKGIGRSWKKSDPKNGVVITDSIELLDRPFEEVLAETPTGLSFISSGRIYDRVTINKFGNEYRNDYILLTFAGINPKNFFTNLHELGHIIDGIAAQQRRDNFYNFIETTAELFCGRIAISRDSQRSKLLLEREENFYHGERKDKIQNLEEAIKQYEQVSEDLFHIGNHGGRKFFSTIAYVISLSSPKEVPRRIKEVRDYMFSRSA